MSLDDRALENDGCSWGIAMVSHGQLDMLRAPKAYKSLVFGNSALGDVDSLKAFIRLQLGIAKQAQGGYLPEVVSIPVTGSDIPLVIPAALGPTAVLTFQQAARQGITAVSTAAATLSDTRQITAAQNYQAQWQQNHPDATPAELQAEMTRWRRSTGNTDAAPESMRRQISTLMQANGIPADQVDAETQQQTAALLENGIAEDTSLLTATQQVAACAVVAASVVEVAIAGAVAEYEGSQALQTTQAVLAVMAPVCDVLAVACAGVPIAAAIFEILALVCRFINWILDAIAQYTIPPAEGWNKEWDGTDCTMILRDRLRILVQCDESVISSAPSGWAAHWVAAMEARGHNATERWEAMKYFIQQTALNRGPERVGAAKSIAQLLGGREATTSLNMCEDVKNWLLYVGVSPQAADAVYTWLYEARKITVVRERRVALGISNRNDAGRNVEYTGNTVSYIHKRDNCTGRCSPLGGDEYHCQVNFIAGTDEYYKNCHGLDTTNPSQFRPFSFDALKQLHADLAEELRVIPAGGLGAAQLVGGRAVPATGAAAQAAARYWLRQFTSAAIPESFTKCGFVTVAQIPCLYIIQNPTSPVVPLALVRTDTRTYMIGFSPSAKSQIVAFCGTPNMRPSVGGVVIGRASRPFVSAPTSLRSYIASKSFKDELLNVILNSRRRSTSLTPTYTASGGGGGAALAIGVAAAAAVGAALLMKK